MDNSTTVEYMRPLQVSAINSVNLKMLEAFYILVSGNVFRLPPQSHVGISSLDVHETEQEFMSQKKLSCFL